MMPPSKIFIPYLKTWVYLDNTKIIICLTRFLKEFISFMNLTVCYQGRERELIFLK